MADATTTNVNAQEELDKLLAEAEASAPPEAPAGEAAPEPAGVTFFTMLQLVPVAIREYLLSQRIAKARDEVYGKFGLSEEERFIAMHTEYEVFFGDCPLEEFPDRLFSKLPWKDEDEEKARQLAVEILGRVLMPAQSFVGDVAGLVAELGGDPLAFPQEQVEVRTTAYSMGADEVLSALNMPDLGPDMEKRLRHIIESRLRNIRDDVETKEMLMKSKKVAGLEFPEADADRIVKMIAARSQMTKFVEQVEEEAPKAEEAASEKALSASDIKMIYAGPKEEQEQIAKRLARYRQVTGGDGGKMREAYHQVLFPPDLRPTDQLYVVAGLVALAEDGQFRSMLEDDERYKQIVEKYLRSLGRDAEVEEFLNAPASRKHANILLQLLLAGYGGFDAKESARFGLRVVNALKKSGLKEYDGLVVFDMEKGEFRWTEPIELPET